MNRARGDEVFDALVRGARVAGWVIVPVGCSSTLLTRESQREHLPEELTEDVVLVRTGADLIQAIER